MPQSHSRAGLLAGGNFIIDHVKIIDYYPEEETLATILTQSSGNGGGPYNVLKDLAKLGAGFPLEAVGLIGCDEGADWIVQDCARHVILTDRLQRSPDHGTSYTDAFTVQGTGRRTFFHQPGANAHLAPQHFDFQDGSGRWFYLAYLMLLDTLDAMQPDGRTGASWVLEAASAAGFLTIADIVSKESPQFSATVRASLPHLDCLLLNELEAGRIVQRNLRQGGTLDFQAAVAAAREILACGVRRWVVLHAVEGALAVSAGGETICQGSVSLPAGFIKGSTGAGDAFAAGVIHGLHEDLPMDQCLKQGVCAAASCLRHPSASEGILPLEDCLALGGRCGFRAFP